MGDTSSHSVPISAALLFTAVLLAAVVARVGAPIAGERAARPGHSAPAGAKSPAASPLAGHWEADLQGDGRLFTFLFDFSVKGDSLGGTLGVAGRDEQIRVRGTAKGTRLHFEQFGLWDGMLEGASLKLSRGLDGGKVQHMTAHRTPAK